MLLKKLNQFIAVLSILTFFCVNNSLAYADSSTLRVPVGLKNSRLDEIKTNIMKDENAYSFIDLSVEQAIESNQYRGILKQLSDISEIIKKDQGFFDNFLDKIIPKLAPKSMVYLKGIGVQFVNSPSFIASVEALIKKEKLSSTIDMKLVNEALSSKGETWQKTAVRRTPPSKLKITSKTPPQRQFKRTVYIGINGAAGRIGSIVSAIIRNYYNPEDYKIVALNGIKDLEKFVDGIVNPDPTYGNMMSLPNEAEVKYGVTNGQAWISIDGNKILVFNERKNTIPWWKVALDKEIGNGALTNLFVQEASGKGLTTPAATTAHINGGASIVLFTANAKDETNTTINTVNELNILDAKTIADVQANASCTSNCVGPTVTVVHKKYGVGPSYTNTVHSVTGDQATIELVKLDEAERGWTALSPIFTKTGAAKSVPPLLIGMGPGDGHALRGPWQTGSAVDWVGELLKKPEGGLEEVKELFKQASGENPEVIGIGYNMDDANMKGRTESVVIDLNSIELIEGPDNRVFLRIRGAWYDNEWAYGGADMRLTTLLAKSLENGAVLVHKDVKPAKEKAAKPVFEKGKYAASITGKSLPVLRAQRPSKEIRGTVGIVLNGISINDEIGRDILRTLILTGNPNFSIIALNGSIKTLEELRGYADHINFATNYPRLELFGIKASGHQDTNGQLYLDIAYASTGDRVSIPVHSNEALDVSSKGAVILELDKGYKPLSLKSGQARVYAPGYEKKDGLVVEGVNEIKAGTQEVSIPSSMGALYAQILNALKNSGLGIEMASLQAMVTPRPGVELLTSGGRTGHMNNLVPMSKEELDSFSREVKSLIGNDIPLSFGGYTTAVVPGIAYGGLVLFFKSAVPYSEEGDKLADAQIAYIHNIIKDKLSGIIDLSSSPEVGEHVRGMPRPRIVMKTTKAVGGILITLVPTVDERYSAAHRMLNVALDLAIANGKEPLKKIHKTELAKTGKVLNIGELGKLAGKKVLVRVDFNVPFDDKGQISDDNRIKAALPTIRYLIDQGAKVILCSHLGKPDGKVKPELAMAPVVKKLSELLGKEVAYTMDWKLEDDARNKADSLKNGDVLLLENLRFHPGEEANDPEFARRLASFGEVYVNDAFGTAHRSHASTVGVIDYIPVKAAGLLVEKEIKSLNESIYPEKPAIVVLGGAKISDKFETVLEMVTSGKFNTIIIGGGMANTFLKAKGLEVGTSLVENQQIGMAAWLLKEAKTRGVNIILPIDAVIADNYANEANTRIVDIDKVPEDWMRLDIGPKTRELFKDIIAKASFIFWNGTMGVSEMPSFKAGTEEIAMAIVKSQAKVVIGGGDTVAAMNILVPSDILANRENLHPSTGGGATLEYYTRGNLPAVTAL